MSGWKDIATYLDKGVRTVQRYEREFGLPVRRPAGRPRGSVVATKAELDAWVSASPIRAAFLLSPHPAESPDVGLEKLKLGMEEMGRLRDQLTALRLELRASVASVRGSVDDMEREMLRNWALAPNLSSLSMQDAGMDREKNVVHIRPGKQRIS